MNVKKLRDANIKAWKAMIKADSLLGSFAGMLIFDGFGWQEPDVAFVADGILLTFNEYEMYAEDAIELMEKNEVITIEDFTNSSRFRKKGGE